MIATEGDKVRVSGRLTLQSTAALFAQGLPLVPGKSELAIDLSAVEAVDSSAISLMLSWLRAADRNGIKILFVNVPDNLRSLANLYGVAETLALATDA